MTSKVFEYDPAAEGGQAGYVKPSLQTIASKRGYHSWGTSEEKETMFERYSRIKDEIRRFQERLEALAQYQSDEQCAVHQTVGTTDVAADMKEMQTTLADDDGQWQQADATIKRAQNGMTKLGKALPLHIYIDTASSSLLPLDRQLAHLEKTVGHGVQMELGSLQQRLCELMHRAELLTEHKFENVLRRTKHLATEIDTLDMPDNYRRNSIVTVELAKAQQVAAEEKQQKIEDFLVTSRRLEQAMHSVSQATDRLKAQKDIHTESASVLQRVEILRQKQSAVSMLLQRDISSLRLVQTSLGSNLEIMKKNAQELESRV